MNSGDGRPPRPWKLVARGEERDLVILRIREDLLEHPRTGAAHPRVVIDCPDWVNVLAMTPRRQVVMVRQYRNGVGALTLELPGGLVDPGEAPEAAAARELEEETGYRPKRMVPLGWLHPNPPLQSNRCYSFMALDCERVSDGHPDGGEDIQVELHARDALPQMIREGQVTHALTVSALYLAEHLP